MLNVIAYVMDYFTLYIQLTMNFIYFHCYRTASCKLQFHAV